MFIIVRHGNTFEPGEQPCRIGARTDPPLTAAGFAQAQSLGEHFAQQGWHFTKALISPLLRTRQTSQAILASQPKPKEPQVSEFLREIDHGPDEGEAEELVVRRIGQAALDAWETCAVAPPDWRVDPTMRIAGWQDLFVHGHYGADPTLVVTSSGAARFALLADPALQVAAASLPNLKLPTGGYGVITRNEAGRLRLDAWGVRP